VSWPRGVGCDMRECEARAEVLQVGHGSWDMTCKGDVDMGHLL